jgi:hypothetical protein
MKGLLVLLVCICYTLFLFTMAAFAHGLAFLCRIPFSGESSSR